MKSDLISRKRMPSDINLMIEKALLTFWMLQSSAGWSGENWSIHVSKRFPLIHQETAEELLNICEWPENEISLL